MIATVWLDATERKAPLREDVDRMVTLKFIIDELCAELYIGYNCLKRWSNFMTTEMNP